MRRHAITITAGALGCVWLISIAVQLFFVAGLASISYLIGAIVAQIAAFLVASAVMLVTNTRRPAGIDPNAPTMNRARDPFAEPAADLRGAVMVGNRPYGRRGGDDVSVVHRLIDRLEKDDDKRPSPAQTPSWALDLQQEHEDAAQMFPDAPKEDDDAR